MFFLENQYVQFESHDILITHSEPHKHVILLLYFLLGYRQQPHLHYIYDAVSAYAHALKRMHAEVCGIHHVGLCEGMDPGELKGLPLLLHLEEVNFTSMYR